MEPYPRLATKLACTEEPSYLRGDSGLACLTSQLGQLNAQIRYHDYFKKSVADAEEQCKQELAAPLAKSLMSSSSANDSNGHNGKPHSSQLSSLTTRAACSDATSNWDQCVKHW